jgi:hypothetical protein
MLSKLSDEVEHAAFAGADRYEFAWQSPTSPSIKETLPDACEEMLVIAPFVQGGFIDAARRCCGKPPGRLTIVSRTASLDALSPELRQQMEQQALVFVEDVPGLPSLGLHGKLIAWKRGKQGGALLGSANATGAAWGLGAAKNWEAVVLVNDATALRRIERDFVFKTRGRQQIHPWLAQYHESTDRSESTDPLQEELDRYRLSLGEVSMRASWGRLAANSELGTLRLSVAAPSLALERLATNNRVSCSVGWLPLSRAPVAEDAVPLSRLLAGEVSFADVPAAELSALARIVIRLVKTGRSLECLLVITRTDYPTRWRRHRDHAVLRSEFNGAKLEQVLLDLLRGYSSDPVVPEGPDSPDGNRQTARRAETVPLRGFLEPILQRCVDNPGLLEDVEHVLASDLERSATLSRIRELVAHIKAALR